MLINLRSHWIILSEIDAVSANWVCFIFPWLNPFSFLKIKTTIKDDNSLQDMRMHLDMILDVWIYL
jgi:hypothetical protein